MSRFTAKDLPKDDEQQTKFKCLAIRGKIESFKIFPDLNNKGNFKNLRETDGKATEV